MTEREFELSRRDLLRYAAQGAAFVGARGDPSGPGRTRLSIRGL